MLNGFNFTDRARQTLAVAREQAVRLQHEYIGTEHLLLALLAIGDGVAHTIVKSLGADIVAVRDTVERIVMRGRGAVALDEDLPYTTRGKKVLELALDEAKSARQRYVGEEHLLLGLLREERGIGAQVLVNAGVTLQAARAETLRLFAG